MNDRIREMKEEIERRGGVLHLGEELPDAIMELFLDEVLNCPDCMAAARLEGSMPKRLPEH